jgi:hypothetical protein
MGRRKEVCPRCGYPLWPKGKRILRILVEEEHGDLWEDFAINFQTKGQAFKELLMLAGLLKEEKTRAYVEPPTKKV